MGSYEEYKELLEKALETDTKEDRIELAEWLYRYGDKWWNGELWFLPDSRFGRLKPIIEFTDEDEVNGELVDAEFYA